MFGARKFILVLYGLATCNLAATDILSIEIHEMSGNKLKSVLIKLESPCTDLEAAWEYGEINWLQDELVWKRNAHNYYLIRECNVMIDNHLDPLLDSIANCLPFGRLGKRSIEDAIIETAVDVIGIGATNFVKSYFGKTGNVKDAELVDTLLKGISDWAKRFLGKKEFRQQQVVNGICSVSESAPYHLDELIETARLSPLMTWSAQHVQNEILAVFANLKTVAKYCRNRKLATREVAELSGDIGLATIDPDRTVLVDVIVNKNARTIQLIFELKKKSNYVYYLCAVGVVLSLFTLFVAVFIYRLRKLRGNEQELREIRRRENAQEADETIDEL